MRTWSAGCKRYSVLAEVDRKMCPTVWMIRF